MFRPFDNFFACVALILCSKYDTYGFIGLKIRNDVKKIQLNQTPLSQFYLEVILAVLEFLALKV